MAVADRVCEQLASDLAEAEGTLVTAIAEAATYRQMLLMALVEWEVDRRKRLGAEQRLQQLMGSESWTPENDAG